MLQEDLYRKSWFLDTVQYCIVQNEGISKLNIKNVYIMKVLQETKQGVFKLLFSARTECKKASWKLVKDVRYTLGLRSSQWKSSF
jgi:hypothetical protein